MAEFGMGQQQPQQGEAVVMDSSTPFIAASDGNIALLQESLANLKLSVTMADENGYTLLQAAASYSQIATMQWILSQFAQPNDVNAVDQEGDSALHYASSAEACKVLISANIDKYIRNNEGKTALEAKQQELQEMMDDEDEFDEDDLEVIALRECINCLGQL
jgi:ankyrin repeat protein